MPPGLHTLLVAKSIGPNLPGTLDNFSRYRQKQTRHDIGDRGRGGGPFEYGEFDTFHIRYRRWVYPRESMGYPRKSRILARISSPRDFPRAEYPRCSGGGFPDSARKSAKPNKKTAKWPLIPHKSPRRCRENFSTLRNTWARGFLNLPAFHTAPAI